jgi:hypothetical protein
VARHFPGCDQPQTTPDSQPNIIGDEKRAEFMMARDVEGDKCQWKL